MTLLNRRHWLACSALSWGPFVHAGTTGPELLMVTAAAEPYVLPPQHPLGEGMDIDLAREALMRGGGYRLRVEHVPWRRVLVLLKAGQADLSAGVHDTAERREYLAFSQPYGGAVRYSFYTRRDSGVSIRQLADLQGKRLGLMAGAVFPDALQAAMTGPLERTVDLNSQLRMLAAGRVEVVVGNELPARWLVQHQPYGSQLQRQPFTFDSGAPTQMAFSRRRPDFEQALAAMNRGLVLLAREHRWATLEARYVGA
jgi:polar amino acid transport system substrate-binding protein